MIAAVFPLLAARSLTAAFDYVVPARLAGGLRRGSLVAVPLGRATVLGVVVGISSTSTHSGRLLELRDVVDLPPVPGDCLDLAARLRDYYVTSYGAALAAIVPPAAALRIEKRFEASAEGRAARQRGEPGSEQLEPWEGGCVDVAG